MRDVYPITVQVGYQFAMRWMNAHIFYLKKGSPLSKRILDITQSMPLNHPEFRDTIVEKVLLSRLQLTFLSTAFTAAGRILRRVLETSSPCHNLVKSTISSFLPALPSLCWQRHQNPMWLA